MDTFDNDTWPPLVGTQGTGTLREREVQFGDGYVQEAPDGINVHLQEWPLSWVGKQGSALDPVAIRDWLVAHTGTRFQWTPPGGAQGQYVCKGPYSLVPLGLGNYQLSATFTERATP